MSSKDIYEAGRFAANRYAAGRYRGIGVAIVAQPHDGWVAGQLNRVARATQLSRVVWARPQGGGHGE